MTTYVRKQTNLKKILKSFCFHPKSLIKPALVGWVRKQFLSLKFCPTREFKIAKITDGTTIKSALIHLKFSVDLVRSLIRPTVKKIAKSG